MTTQAVANRYMELFKAKQIAEIYDQLYSTNIVCTEPEHAAAMGVPTITTGIVAVKAKAATRHEMIATIHGNHFSEPVVGGSFFSLQMGRDVTFKNGQRMQLDEIAVFGVKDDKIISETFFY